MSTVARSTPAVNSSTSLDLPTPGIAEHGHERARAGRAPCARRSCAATRAPARGRRSVPAAGAAGLEDADRPPRPDLLAGPNLDRTDVLDLDRLDRQAPRAGAEHDRARRRRLLQPGGDVDRFAGREGRGDVLDYELARLDPDPRLEAEIARRRRARRTPRGPRARRRPRGSAVRRMRPSPRRPRTSRRCRRTAGSALRRCRNSASRGGARPPGRSPCEQRRRVDQIDEDHRCELPFHRSILGSRMG